MKKPPTCDTWAAWARNWNHAKAFFESKAIPTTRSRLKTKWYNQYLKDMEGICLSLENIPFKCPSYQCGGIMKSVEADFPAGMPGDDQFPDLVCENCKAIYQFQGFRRKKMLAGSGYDERSNDPGEQQ